MSKRRADATDPNQSLAFTILMGIAGVWLAFEFFEGIAILLPLAIIGLVTVVRLAMIFAPDEDTSEAARRKGRS